MITAWNPYWRKKRKDKTVQPSLFPEERNVRTSWKRTERQELVMQIATLTENIEKLRYEKEMCLRSLDFTGDAVMCDGQNDTAAAEALLKKLEEQEENYSATLRSALQQYRILEAQAIEYDTEEGNDSQRKPHPSMDRPIFPESE